MRAAARAAPTKWGRRADVGIGPYNTGGGYFYGGRKGGPSRTPAPTEDGTFVGSREGRPYGEKYRAGTQGRPYEIVGICGRSRAQPLRNREKDDESRGVTRLFLCLLHRMRQQNAVGDVEVR